MAFENKISYILFLLLSLFLFKFFRRFNLIYKLEYKKHDYETVDLLLRCDYALGIILLHVKKWSTLRKIINTQEKSLVKIITENLWTPRWTMNSKQMNSCG